MKRTLLIISLIVFASSAHANLSFSEDYIWSPIGNTVTFEIISDTAEMWQGYVGNYLDPTGAIFLRDVIELPPSGDDPIVIPIPGPYAGYFQIGSIDLTAPISVAAGPQFQCIVDVVGMGIYDINLFDGGWDYENPLDVITIDSTPEPVTISLLAVGGLFLRRRR